MTISADANSTYEVSPTTDAYPQLHCPAPDRDRPFIVPIFLPHAGCPHRCVFCNQYGLNQTPTNPAITPETLGAYVTKVSAYRSNRRRTAQLAFYGGNFLGLPLADISRWLDAASSCVDQKMVDGIRFSTRPDTIDPEMINLLSPYPIATIELGAQSMDDGVLLLSNRGHTTTHTVNAVRWLHETPYRIGIQLMVGLPGDSDAVNRRTGLQVCALGPDFVRIYPTLVLKNSRLANWYASGRYQPLSLEKSIQRSMTLLKLFQAHHIAVIRMGLQASGALDERDALLAGPYHPAFGNLVYSELFFETICTFLQSQARIPATLTLGVHPRSVSKLKGNRNQNVARLKRKFDVQKLRISISRMIPMDAVVINDNPLIRLFETPDTISV